LRRIYVDGENFGHRICKENPIKDAKDSYYNNPANILGISPVKKIGSINKIFLAEIEKDKTIYW